MKCLLVVGTRPNFMKIADSPGVLLETKRAFNYRSARCPHRPAPQPEHVGRLLPRPRIPEPDINLEVGSGSHAEQTAHIMMAFELACQEHRPDWVIVVGDVNSTVACALTAKNLGIRIAHVEAGLPSRDMSRQVYPESGKTHPSTMEGHQLGEVPRKGGPRSAPDTMSIVVRDGGLAKHHERCVLQGAGVGSFTGELRESDQTREMPRKWDVRERRILTEEETRKVFAHVRDPYLLICETCLDIGARIRKSMRAIIRARTPRGATSVSVAEGQST